MEIAEIRVRDRTRMRGLKNKGLIEISQNPKTGDFVLIMGKGIRKKWLLFSLPEGMWRARCSKQEVLDVVEDFLRIVQSGRLLSGHPCLLLTLTSHLFLTVQTKRAPKRIVMPIMPHWEMAGTAGGRSTPRATLRSTTLPSSLPTASWARTT